jgi:hypothetical protein
MQSENGRHDKVERNQRPQRSLHIVRSVAGVDRWHALWDWLLAPEPPTEPAAKESEVANGDSQEPHASLRPSQEQNEDG